MRDEGLMLSLLCIYAPNKWTEDFFPKQEKIFGRDDTLMIFVWFDLHQRQSCKQICCISATLVLSLRYL